jgi:hypothetical protein
MLRRDDPSSILSVTCSSDLGVVTTFFLLLLKADTPAPVGLWTLPYTIIIKQINEAGGCKRGGEE